MSYHSPRGFTLIPPVVKNLLIINGLVMLFFFVSHDVRVWMMQHLALWSPLNDNFIPTQFVTYMFLHDFTSPFHLLFNMFSLWMFGTWVENIWGGRRFLSFYMFSGIGAAVVHTIVNYFMFQHQASSMDPAMVDAVLRDGANLIFDGQSWVDGRMNALQSYANIPTVGASGAVYGVLVAYAMMFPNNTIYFYFFIPLKVKYFVPLMIAFDLFSGIQGNSNVAHFAHLGGALAGFLYIISGRLKRFIK